MAVRRNKWKPTVKLDIWHERDGLFFVEPEKLTLAMLNSGRQDDVLKKELGAGASYVNTLFAGHGIDKFSASFVDSIISPVSKEQTISQSYSPPPSTAFQAEENQVAKMFDNLKYEVRRLLREAKPSDRRDGAIGVDLQGAQSWLEELESLAKVPTKERDLVRIGILWSKVVEVGQKYKIFKRYDGNTLLRQALLKFLNGIEEIKYKELIGD